MKRRSVVVGAMLAFGEPAVLASVPLSASTFDASPDRDATRDAPDSDGMAAALAVAIEKGPVGRVDWWIGFRDSTLNLLEQMARDRSRRPSLERTVWRRGGVRGEAEAAVDIIASSPHGPDADDIAASLASAYVQARVLRVRLATAQAVVLTARRQVEQSQQSKQPGGNASAQEAAAAAQRAAAMAERGQAAAADFEATLARRIGEIAALTGMAPAQARTVLEPSLSTSQLPVFTLAVPSRLPAQVVRGRADVRSREASLLRQRTRAGGQYQVAEFAATIGGWIEPHGDSSIDVARRDVVARAKAEVGTALYRLVRQQQAAAMNYEMSRLRRTEFETVLQRQELGEAADGEVLEKHLLLLAENDRLAAAVGAIADSWIALNAATGGLAAIAAGGRTTSSAPAGAAPPRP